MLRKGLPIFRAVVRSAGQPGNRTIVDGAAILAGRNGRCSRLYVLPVAARRRCHFSRAVTGLFTAGTVLRRTEVIRERPPVMAGLRGRYW